ncbi:MAG: potassium transporter TrkG [Schleiferiaceae bacterium]|nr:potassium transporter TrkG [Schleiferiaceae bacterium]
MKHSRRLTVNRIREWVNLRIYDSKTTAIRFLRYTSVPLSIAAVISLLLSHGFVLESEQSQWVDMILKGTIGFYIVKYVVEFFYSFSPIQYLKDSRWEGLLMLYMVVNILSFNLFGIEILSTLGGYLGLEKLDAFFMVFIQAYFLLFVALEIGKASRLLPMLKVSPPALLVSSFILLMIVGAGLLWMPEMTKSGDGLSIKEALFTSVSAVSVTGLNIIDISEILSFKGKFILLFLIQLGGLNFIAFASIFAMLANPALGTRYKRLLQTNYGSDSLEGSVDLIREIFRFSFFFEFAAAILLFFSWGDFPFMHLGDRIFYSVFHAVSAFNNAGFSLFSHGMAHPALAQNVPLVMIIAMTIILGGLGFTTIHDLFSTQAYTTRRKNPWIHLNVNTKIAIYTTLILIPAGGILYAVLEWNSSLFGLDHGHRILTAFFQSVTTRTAGFNTVDFGAVALPTLLILIIFMFIGGSSGSTAGGIKTSTFTLVFVNALATIRGRKRVELFHSTIPVELLNLAMSAFLFSASSILLGIFLLTVTDGHLGLARLAFEEVSAFCTVGLSTGITSELSNSGQTILMLSMLIGRVGTVTLAFALTSRKKESHEYTYPKANVQVG